MDIYLSLQLQGYKLLDKTDILTNAAILHSDPDIYAAYTNKCQDHLAGKVQFQYSFNGNPVEDPTGQMSYQFGDFVQDLLRQWAISGLLGVTTGRDIRLDERREARKQTKDYAMKQGLFLDHDNDGESADGEHVDKIMGYNPKKRKWENSNKTQQKKQKRTIDSEDYDEVDDYIQEHKDDTRPVCVDLTKIDIFYKPSIYKHTIDFRVFEPTNREFGSDIFFFQFQSSNTPLSVRELKHIKIIQLEPFTAQGRIQSIVSRCIAIVNESNLIDYHTNLAMKANALPVVPLESIPQAHNPDDLIGLGATPGYTGDSIPKDVQPRNLPGSAMDSNGGNNNSNDILIVDARNDNVQLATSSIYYIPEGRKVASYVQPKEPENQMEKRIYKKQLIYQCFGIPYGIVLNYNPIQGSSGGSASKLGAGQSNTTTSSAFELLVQNRKAVNQWLVHVSQDLLDRMTLAYRAAALPKQPHNARILITLPGLPTEEKVNNLYAMGVFKYEKLVSYQCAINGFKDNDFIPESQREMNIKELNGIVEKPEEGGGSSKKK